MKGDAMAGTSKESLLGLYLRSKDVFDSIVRESVQDAASKLGQDNMLNLFSLKDSHIQLVSKQAA